MTGARTATASVVERARHYRPDAPVMAAAFLGDAAAFVLGEEALMLARGDDCRRIAVHAGAILAAACDGERLVTGGDDGTVKATDAAGASAQLATDAKKRWIDQVAIGPGRALAWSAGKDACVRLATGTKVYQAPSTVGALAFAPKGLRLAIAHYNGVSLWLPNAKSEPERLEWKGSHRAASFSPDGRFLITAMQEPSLHGWRLADRKDMRMQGYAARVRSLDWTADGRWLASSGASQLVLWPFRGKDGPMGKPARALAPAAAQVEVVACHPKEAIVAVGYADGLIVLVRLEDGAEILARKPAGAPVTTLAWSRAGNLLAFGSEDQDAGVVDLA